MGVTGLWKLIEPCGNPVPLETLEGKVLAVDVSIWLHQVIKGFQDNKGSALAHAHLLGLFHRLCKLLYYRVRPVFVFDGSVPQLKRDTIARRQQQRTKLNSEAERIQALLLQSLAKEKIVQQALGANATELLLKSPAKRAAKRTESDIDDMFKLPEAAEMEEFNNERKNENNEWGESSYSTADDFSTTMEDSSYDESNPRYSYNVNLQAIDVRSEHFRNLPAEVRHEILVDIKETRKQSSWGRLHELPSKSDDFSCFQIKRLLKRRAVQESLEEVEQEMGGRSITFAELKSYFTEEGILEPSAMEKHSKQICSDENTRFLLVRDLKKKLTEVEENQLEKKVEEQLSIKTEIQKTVNAENEELPTTSKTSKIETNVVQDNNSKRRLGEEYDADLALALAMSLEESGVYREQDYVYEADENLKLNREQRKNLKNAAIGPARAYMIEYAGMNGEEVVGIMETTQACSDAEDIENSDVVEERKNEATVDLSKLDTIQKNNDSIHSEQEKKNPLITLRDEEDSDTDSDLEEVMSSDEKKDIKKNITKEKPIVATNETDADTELDKLTTEKLKSKDEKGLQIIVDFKKTMPPEDDLFAGIFENNNKEAPKNTEEATKENSINLQNDVTSSKAFENVNMQSILGELKQQMADVNNINLNDIKVSNENSVIEISDEEIYRKPKQPTKSSEVIEITDEADERVAIPKTPTKHTTITEYYDVAYSIKRTPDKPRETEKDVSKVKSPFFVKKNTPKSARKETNNTTPKESPTKQMSKAAKSLFGTEDHMPEEPAATPLVSTEDLMQAAANALKEQKSETELHELATDLAKQRRELESERNRQDRMGMSVSQRMSRECQELLQLFGIPYIVAPMEAEAQCAFLDAVELTNGTITDDSDIWLFGGRTVYKNFFAQNKHVLEFRAEQIKKHFNCERKDLIQLACLVGSDYTIGVHGIGAVTALEILASFSSTKETKDDTTNAKNAQVSNAISNLVNFRNWWLAQKSSAHPIGSSAQLSLRKKIKNIELYEGFPNLAVVEAYLTPKVDESKETFSWGHPDIEAIQEFTRKVFGWTKSKTDDILMPVIKKLKEKKSQASIRNYFQVKNALTVRQLKVSKRVQNAINQMNGTEEQEMETKPAAKSNTRRTKRKAVDNTTSAEKNDETMESMMKTFSKVSKRSQRKAVLTTADETVEPVANADMCLESSTSHGPKRITKGRPRIPNTKEVIPQKESSLKQLFKNNEKAVELFKSNKTSKSQKKRKV